MVRKAAEVQVTSMDRASKRILREDGDREERGERKIKPPRHHNKRGEYEVEIIASRDQGIRTMINAIDNPRTNRSSVPFFLFCWRERSLALFGMARLLTIHHVTPFSAARLLYFSDS